MYWLILILAGIFEVGFTFCLKKTENFSNMFWNICFGICASMSFLLLNYTLRYIPLGTSYAVWTGIGAAGTVILGIFLFDERADFWRVFFIVMLIVAIIGLKIVSTEGK